jgi:hypothetical protein
MPLGIGGGGQLGFAFEVTPPPVVAGNPTAGGALTAGVYKYYVTAITATGETSVSNEVTVTTTAGNLTAALTWGAVTGATGYKVYRTAAGGASGTELLLATLGVVLLYNDAAVGAPAGAFPTTNTATAAGTYVAPTKFVPINSENILYQQDTTWRRPIRRSVGVQSAIPGNAHVEGDIEFEVTEDVLPYFMYISRMDVVRSGGAPNYIYTGTPNALATPARTASITIERVGGVVFGYVGCVVSSFTISVQDGALMFSASILGRDEASQTVPVPTWPTTTPYGAGQYIVELPVGTTITDTDTFEFQVEDNGDPQYRLKNTGRGAQFIKYGERNCTTTMERDFTDRTDYDNFKAYTGQAIRLTATKGANNSVVIDLPVAIKDTYEVGLNSQGDLVRAQIAYQNIVNASGAEYTLTVKTQELVS